ncbi:MAG: hypothetical protein MN733_15395 [Nitrososphaera sp.]|nr:hypothetical protein [Nitrososphaera sp.]
MKVLVLAALLLCCSSLAYAQNQNRRELGQEQLPRSGVAHITINSAFSPNNLQHLVDNSELIIEGEVESLLGSRYYGRVPETDFQIDVKRVFKALPGKALPTKVIIPQVGGTIGGLQMINDEDPLMELGEKAFFFLRAEDRNNLLDFGFPRYTIKGVHHGRIRISDDKVKPSRLQYFARQFQDRPSEDLRTEILRAKQK